MRRMYSEEQIKKIASESGVKTQSFVPGSLVTEEIFNIVKNKPESIQFIDGENNLYRYDNTQRDDSTYLCSTKKLKIHVTTMEYEPRYEVTEDAGQIAHTLHRVTISDNALSSATIAIELLYISNDPGLNFTSRPASDVIYLVNSKKRYLIGGRDLKSGKAITYATANFDTNNVDATLSDGTTISVGSGRSAVANDELVDI